jgi:hypothetical protein
LDERNVFVPEVIVAAFYFFFVLPRRCWHIFLNVRGMPAPSTISSSLANSSRSISFSL